MRIPFFLVIFFTFSQAVNIYVATWGSDSSGDGSLNKPFATPYAASLLAKAGDHIQLQGGVYQMDQYPKALTLKGMPNAPIVVEPVAGAKAILDGEKTAAWAALLGFSQSEHFIVQNLEVRNCVGGYGINWSMSRYGTIQYNTVHGIGQQAIAGSGDYMTIQYNHVYNGSLVNQNGSKCKPGNCGGWPAAVMSFWKDDYSSSTNYKFLHNYVHDIWGEGIISFFMQEGEVGYNTIENCFSVGIYTDTSKDIYIHSNFVYSNNPIYNRPDSHLPQSGFSISTEFYSQTEKMVTNTPSNITIANNLVINTSNGVSDWRDSRNTKSSNTYRDFYIYYNVILDPVSYPISFAEVPSGYPAPTGCYFQNNVVQSKLNYLILGNPSGWEFSHNDWVNGVPSDDKGNHELSIDPQFVNPTIAAGPNGFALKSGSGILRAGVPTRVNVDFWGKPRSQTNPTPGIWEPSL